MNKIDTTYHVSDAVKVMNLSTHWKTFDPQWNKEQVYVLISFIYPVKAVFKSAQSTKEN